MKKQLLLYSVFIALFSCTQQQSLYQSDAYEIGSRYVKQDTFLVEVENASSMVSSYISPYKKATSKVLDFKFALNGKDNERYPGEGHHVFLESSDGTLVSEVYTFGAPDPVDTIVQEERRGEILPDHIQVTIRVDMKSVLSSFQEKGYFELFNGEHFLKDEYEGVFIAGNTLPLSWDFANLSDQPELQMQDSDGDGIFEIELLIKKFQQVEARMDNAQWNQQSKPAKYPTYSSDIPLSDAMYQLSLEELKLDIREDGAFMAGAKWPGVWTRDISYSILLSLAILEPEVAKASLLHKVQNDRIIQDTGTGGSWPVSTDRMTWSLAAWEIFKVTGDLTWLSKAYNIIRNSAEDDLLTIFNPETGLAYGESSFLDWREQSYPRWMDPKDIFTSQNIGTNIVHFETYHILAEMAALLKMPEAHTRYDQVSKALKESINEHMWIEDKGYYSQYIYGRSYQSPSPRSETLGEALSILFGVASTERSQSIVSMTPTTPFGTTCFYPQIPDLPPYHNNGIWPFVEAFWGWSAARAGNSASVEHSIASIYRPAALFLSNKENMVAETGDFMGTEINSDRQLWSVAGNLAVVYRMFYGMEFSPEGLTLSPFIPENYKGHRKLSDFSYRGSILDISIEGYGDQIKTMYLDGSLIEGSTIPANLSGKHDVVIEMNDHMPESAINLQPVKFSPDTPIPVIDGSSITWDPIADTQQYQVFRNGVLIETVKEASVRINSDTDFSEYQIMAISPDGLQSFLSEPVSIPGASGQIIDLIDASYSSEHQGFTGKGYSELTKGLNTSVTFSFNIPRSGLYSFDFRYNNGHGPINTNNKCAIRSASLDGAYIGAFVLAQRGDRNWTDWGYSNALKIQLETGQHELVLEFLPHNENMNLTTNSALLDFMRITPLD